MSLGEQLNICDQALLKDNLLKVQSFVRVPIKG